MAPNYSFFCLLFSSGAQPRKPRLPLPQCFDSGLQRAHFLHKQGPQAPAGALLSPRGSQGHILHHQHPLHCLVSCHGKIPCPDPFFPEFCVCPREGSPRLGGVQGNGSVQPNQRLHSWLLLGTRDKSRRKGPDPSQGSSPSSRSHSAGIS